MGDMEIEIRIGKNVLEDVKKIMKNPGLAYKEPRHAVYFKSFKELNKVLSTKRLELINYLICLGPKSVTQVSKALGRKQENVSKDLHILAGINLVTLQKHGRQVVPKANCHSLKLVMA